MNTYLVRNFSFSAQLVLIVYLVQTYVQIFFLRGGGLHSAGSLMNKPCVITEVSSLFPPACKYTCKVLIIPRCVSYSQHNDAINIHLFLYRCFFFVTAVCSCGTWYAYVPYIPVRDITVATFLFGSLPASNSSSIQAVIVDPPLTQDGPEFFSPLQVAGLTGLGWPLGHPFFCFQRLQHTLRSRTTPP